MRMIEETYEEIRGLIRKTARHLQSRYGWDAEEMECEGNETFMRVYKDFDPQKGSFSKRMRAKMKYAILERASKERDQAKRRVQMPAEFVARRTFDLSVVLRDVSEDCKTLLGIIFDGQETQTVNYYRRSVVPTLEGMGWLPFRIENVIEEIRGVIHDPEYSSA